MDEDLFHSAVDRGVLRGFHFHRLDGEERIAGLHLLARLHRDGGDDARHRRGDMAGLILRRLAADGDIGGGVTVGHADHARLAVQLEEDAGLTLLVNIADDLESDDVGFARLEVDRDLVAADHAVEEDRRRQIGDGAVFADGGGELDEHLRVHEI